MSNAIHAESADNDEDSRFQRVSVYIDGINLYRSISDAYLRRYLWLDLEAFARTLLIARQRLVRVHYYTAAVKGKEKRERQQRFLIANSESDLLGIRLGRIDFNEVPCGSCGTQVACPACGRLFAPPIEKQSDVNLGTQLGLDAASNLFDTAIIVSSDSDFGGAIRLLEELLPHKKVVVCVPPGRHEPGKQLRDEAKHAIHVNASMLRRSQLPNPVTLAHGQTIYRPESWR